MNKKKMFFVILFAAICFLSFLYVMKVNSPTIKKAKIASDSSDYTGWKTYTSKYGFSILYPSIWQLGPAINAKSKEESEKWRKEGYDSFVIYSPSDDSSSGLVIECLGDTDTVMQLSYKNIPIPEDPVERILFLAKESPFTMRYKKDKIKKFELIKVDGGLVYLIHDDTEFSETTGLFYLKKNKVFCIIDASYPRLNKNEEKCYKEKFKNIIKTIKIL